MQYRISEIRIGAREYADQANRMEHVRRALEKALRKKFGRQAIPGEIQIIRESIDARHKPDVKAVYTLDFECDRKLPLPEGGREEYRMPFDRGPVVRPVVEPVMRPVIVGFGPCGIFAALILAEAGLKPLVLERGKKVEQRIRDVEAFWQDGILDPESNVQFGEGGAGTFSDGKLTTGIRDVRIRKVLKTFVEAGADPAILYQQKPHIGTDRLRQIIPRIRRRIEELGGEIRFGTKLTGIESQGGKLTAIQAEHRERRGASCGESIAADGSASQAKTYRIPVRDLVLATGHSARDTFEMLRDLEVPMEPKSFSIGVRIEHPQEQIDAAQYGDPQLAKIFGPAVYKLHHRCGSGRGVYTFCMCPGGRVINASSEEGGLVSNGMSESARDSGTANSGLLVDVRPADFDSDDPLAGVAFQRRYERMAWAMARGIAQGIAQEKSRESARRLQDGGDGDGEGMGCGGHLGYQGLPVTSYGQFREDPHDIVRQCLPGFAVDAILEAMPHLGRKLAGFDAETAVMTAVESRSSSPVRVLRDENMQSGIRGVIPAGEGPGYAGGIVSAAVDGIRAAERIIERAIRA